VFCNLFYESCLCKRAGRGRDLPQTSSDTLCTSSPVESDSQAAVPGVRDLRSPSLGRQSCLPRGEGEERRGGRRNEGEGGEEMKGKDKTEGERRREEEARSEKGKERLDGDWQSVRVREDGGSGT
jgi:hypothetical protein